MVVSRWIQLIKGVDCSVKFCLLLQKIQKGSTLVKCNLRVVPSLEFGLVGKIFCQYLNTLPSAQSKLKMEKKCYPNYDENILIRSCKKEVIEPIAGKISGTIPSWLNGVFVQNGQGSLEVGDYSFKHLFDGSALLHRFAIKDGAVTYQCRFLQTETYKRNQKANRIVLDEFGTVSVPDPCHTIFQRISATFSSNQEVTDNTNVSVYPIGDQLYAFGEQPLIYKINHDNLQIGKKMDIGTNIGVVHHTAHPHVDQDGTVYNLAMSAPQTGPCHNIVCFPANSENDTESMFEQAHVVASIPARWSFYPSYMHSFGITDNYFIIVEQPLTLSTPSMVLSKFLISKPIAEWFKWHEKEMTKINVISRKTGKRIQEFYSKGFCYFHIINQYEISDHIVLDICSYKDASVIDCLFVDVLKNIQHNPEFTNMINCRSIRFVLPLLASNEANKTQNLVNIPNTQAEAHLVNGNIFVKPESLCDLTCEFPKIHYERFSGKEYEFYYALNASIDCENPGMVIKVDTRNKTTLTWYEKDCYLSEPIFVPKPNAQDEDDGVVLTAMLWTGNNANKTGLLILDAKTFVEIGRTEFQIPSPTPRCFHGWFLPQQTV